MIIVIFIDSVFGCRTWLVEKAPPRVIVLAPQCFLQRSKVGHKCRVGTLQSTIARAIPVRFAIWAHHIVAFSLGNMMGTTRDHRKFIFDAKSWVQGSHEQRWGQTVYNSRWIAHKLRAIRDVLAFHAFPDNFAPAVNRQPWLRGKLIEKAIACEHP